MNDASRRGFLRRFVAPGRAAPANPAQPLRIVLATTLRQVIRHLP